MIANEVSCSDCSPAGICVNCDKEDVYCCDDSDDDGDDDSNTDAECEDEEDLGQSEDEMNSDEEEVLDYPVSAPGNIVWAKYGRYYYPAQVVSKSDGGGGGGGGGCSMLWTL